MLKRTLKELHEAGELAVFPGNTLARVKKGAPKKGPGVKWKQYHNKVFDKDKEGFKHWKPLEDTKRSSLIRLGQLVKTKKYYLRVIDLDRKKEVHQIDFKVLEGIFKDLMEKTLTNTTPGGGRHIFILDESESTETEASLGISNQNIDYQNQNKLVNVGFYYIRDKEAGECIKKEYKVLTGSPQKIALISELGFKSVDELLRTKILEIGESYQKASKITERIGRNIKEAREHPGVGSTEYEKYALSLEAQERASDLLSEYVKEGSRQDLALYVAGYLLKIGIFKKDIQSLINRVFVDETNLRLGAIETSLTKVPGALKGWKGIYEIIYSQKNNKREALEEMEKLENIITPPGSEFQRHKIINQLSQGRESAIVRQQIATYLASKFYMLKNSKTGLLYVYDEDLKSFKMISDKELQELASKEFGDYRINIKLARDVEGQFTKYKEPAYNIIQFKNKNLDIYTGELLEKPENPENAPFSIYSLKYNYNPKAKGGLMEKTLKEILDYTNNPDNYRVFLQILGYLLEPGNRLERFFEIVGVPGSGKSILGRIITEIFKPYSAVTLKAIARNQSHDTEALIGARVNIIDDSDSGVIKDLAELKSFTSHSGYPVNPKNKPHIIIPPEEKPKVITFGNKLSYFLDPSKAIYERLILIKTPNKFRNTEKENKNLLNQLKEDTEGMEWLLYNSIQEYLEIRKDGNFSLISDIEEIERMHNLESYPHQVAVQDLFERKYKHEIHTDTAHEAILDYLIMMEKQGCISSKIDMKERSFKTALEMIGAVKTRRFDSNNHSYYIYKNIAFKESQDTSENVTDFKGSDIVRFTKVGKSLYDTGELSNKQDELLATINGENLVKNNPNVTINLIDNIKPNMGLTEIIKTVNELEALGAVEVLDNSDFKDQ